MTTPLEKIRAACIAANPQIAKEWVLCPECLGNGSNSDDYDVPCECPGSVGRIEGRAIRLADVLLAIQEKFATTEYSIMIQATGHMHIVKRASSTLSQIYSRGGSVPDGEFIGSKHGWWYDIFHRSGKWNLLDDDLSHQSEETLQFIASLL